MILVFVNLDPFTVKDALYEVPLWEFGLPDGATIGVEDLMHGNRFTLTGKSQRIHLDPNELPFHIWRLSELPGAV